MLRVDDPRVDFFGAGLRFGLVLRDRVLELPDVVRVVDVLLLRDPGGEDVRVAMVTTLRSGHSRHTDHLSACLVVGRPPRGRWALTFHAIRWVPECPMRCDRPAGGAGWVAHPVVGGP